MCVIDNLAACSLVFTYQTRPSVEPMEAPYHRPSEPHIPWINKPAEMWGKKWIKYAGREEKKRNIFPWRCCIHSCLFMSVSALMSWMGKNERWLKRDEEDGGKKRWWWSNHSCFWEWMKSLTAADGWYLDRHKKTKVKFSWRWRKWWEMSAVGQKKCLSYTMCVMCESVSKF